MELVSRTGLCSAVPQRNADTLKKHATVVSFQVFTIHHPLSKY